MLTSQKFPVFFVFLLETISHFACDPPMFEYLSVDMWVPDAVSGLEALDPITTRVTSRIMAQIGERLPNYEKSIHY